MNPTHRIVRQVIEKRGWLPGTSLENQVMRQLSSGGRSPADLGCVQQFRVGRYKVDFAWPTIKVIMEVDGWYHRSPEGAAKDAERDSWLRANGWLVLRVDDRHGEDALLDQVVRVSALVHALRR